MSFQDELKANYRTKDEANDELREKIESGIYNEAKETLQFIKKCLLDEARAGNSSNEDGKTIVKAHWQIPPDFLHVREEKTEAVYGQSFWGKRTLIKPSSKKMVFSLNKCRRYDLFIEFLTQMAMLEDIEIIKPILRNRNTNKIYDLPYNLEGYYYFLDWGISVLCQTEIKASNPNTVVTAASVLNEIDADDILLSGIVDSLVEKEFNSITTYRSKNNQGITANCYYQGHEYAFSFRCHSLNLDDETIQKSVLQVFDVIIVGEKDLSSIKSQYNDLMTNLSFYNISVNIIDNHVVFIKGHKNGVKYSFRFIYPKEAMDSLPVEYIQSDDALNIINIDYMEGHDFEQFCAKLLLRNGFDSVDVTRGSGDQGVDIIAVKDGVKYGIQCKCYSADIGNSAVQEVFSGKSFYKCHVGVVLTNRFFTRSAVTLAESNGVLLWDRTKLLTFIKNAGIIIE